MTSVDRKPFKSIDLRKYYTSSWITTKLNVAVIPLICILELKLKALQVFASQSKQ